VRNDPVLIESTADRRTHLGQPGNLPLGTSCGDFLARRLVARFNPAAGQ
jgi:hypothetical protein